jgi:hypothetical protein
VLVQFGEKLLSILKKTKTSSLSTNSNMQHIRTVSKSKFADKTDNTTTKNNTNKQIESMKDFSLTPHELSSFTATPLEDMFRLAQELCHHACHWATHPGLSLEVLSTSNQTVRFKLDYKVMNIAQSQTHHNISRNHNHNQMQQRKSQTTSDHIENLQVPNICLSFSEKIAHTSCLIRIYTSAEYQTCINELQFTPGGEFLPSSIIIPNPAFIQYTLMDDITSLLPTSSSGSSTLLSSSSSAANDATSGPQQAQPSPFGQQLTEQHQRELNPEPVFYNSEIFYAPSSILSSTEYNNRLLQHSEANMLLHSNYNRLDSLIEDAVLKIDELDSPSTISPHPTNPQSSPNSLLGQQQLAKYYEHYVDQNEQAIPFNIAFNTIPSAFHPDQAHLNRSTNVIPTIINLPKFIINNISITPYPPQLFHKLFTIVEIITELNGREGTTYYYRDLIHKILILIITTLSSVGLIDYFGSNSLNVIFDNENTCLDPLFEVLRSRSELLSHRLGEYYKDLDAESTDSTSQNLSTSSSAKSKSTSRSKRHSTSVVMIKINILWIKSR